MYTYKYVYIIFFINKDLNHTYVYRYACDLDRFSSSFKNVVIYIYIFMYIT